MFLRSPRQFLGHAAGCVADLVHVLGVAGAAGACAVAPSHGTGREVEGGERRGGGVLQRDTVHSISDEALFCLISQHPQELEKKKGVKTSKTLFHVDNFLQPSLCFLYSTAVLYSITNFQINAKFPISVLFCFQETSTVVLHMIYFQGFLQFPQNQRRP